MLIRSWGTAHATLAARDIVKEPFCVINADDFYGREAYQKMYDFLCNEVKDDTFSMIGYQIDKTLSEHGSVSRGVCEVDENGRSEEHTSELQSLIRISYAAFCLKK